MSDKVFTLTDPQSGRSADLPAVTGTLGTQAANINMLYKQQGIFTYDPAFSATCSCKSEITYIDGDQGVLLYRGYPVEQLAEQSNFLEVSYLLLYGELPSATQMEEFVASINQHTMLNESLAKFYDGFHYDAHPMAMMTGIVGSLSAFYHDTTSIRDPRHRDIFARRMIAKMSTIAAAAYKHSVGQPKRYPRNNLGYAENLLFMMFSVPSERYDVDPVAAAALDLLFILHADHEQNASTSTVRMVGSTGTNPYAAIASGIAALWGPAHGGANEAVVKMLNKIGDAKEVPKYVAKAKDKEDGFRLMGFGHRVYKNFDPRATIIRSHCHKVLSHFGIKDQPMFELALELERVALEDDYFKERKLYPNVDFYSGIIYQALGIPVNMFTCMFAVARTVGWVAHWCEMHNEPSLRIARPRQIYSGKPRRDYIPTDRR